MGLDSSTMNSGRAITAVIQPLTRWGLGGLLCGVVLLILSPGASAAGQSLQARLEQFLQTQTAGTNGQVTVKVNMPKVPLGPCETPQPFLPRRTTQLAGAITVGVKCPGDRPLTRYFRAYVSIKAPYFVAAHLLKTGDKITFDDLRRATGDITRLPPGVITQPDKLLGKITVRRIPKGLPLTKNMVHTQSAVERGDHVSVVVSGDGFSITTSGKALNSAPMGGQVSVRTAAGATVTGIIRGDNTVVIQQ